MKFSPNHNDNRIRAIYGGFIVIAFAMMCFGTGLVRTVLLSLSIVFLGVGLYLFIRCDMTTYTYIVTRKGERLDFYIDKSFGKRGAYVCYYPLTDAVSLEKYERSKRKALKEKHGKVFIYNYCHNKLVGEKYIFTFKNEGYFDSVIIELDKKSFEYLKASMKEQTEGEAVENQ